MDRPAAAADRPHQPNMPGHATDDPRPSILTSNLGLYTDYVACLVNESQQHYYVFRYGQYSFAIYDLHGNPLRVFEGHKRSVKSISVSRDGKHIVSGSYDDTIRVWETATGKCLHVLDGHQEGVSSVAFSPDGTRIVSGGEDGTVRVWDAETGMHLHTLRRQQEAVMSVVFSSDAAHIISASLDGTVCIYEAKTGELLTHNIALHETRITCVALNHDGKHIVSGSSDGIVRIWEAATGDCLHNLKGANKDVTCVAFSPDGERIVSGSPDGIVRIWEVATGECLHTFREQQEAVTSVAVSPDGSRIVSGSTSKTIKVWNLATRECLTTLKGQRSISSAVSVAFSLDGKYVISGDLFRVWVWDVVTGVQLHAFYMAGHAQNVATNPNGRHIAWSIKHENTKIWVSEVGKRSLPQVLSLNGTVRCVTFNHTGTHIVSGSSNGALYVYVREVSKFKLKWSIESHGSAFTCVAFSPDDRYIVSGSSVGRVEVWDVATGTYLKSLRARMEDVISVTFDHDGTCIVSGSSNGTVWAWKTETGEELHELRAHEEAVTSVAVSRDNTCIVSGSLDCTVRVWDAETGKLRCQRQFGSEILSIVFADDGNFLVGTKGAYYVVPSDALLRIDKLRLETPMPRSMPQISTASVKRLELPIQAPGPDPETKNCLSVPTPLLERIFSFGLTWYDLFKCLYLDKRTCLNINAMCPDVMHWCHQINAIYQSSTPRSQKKLREYWQGLRICPKSNANSELQAPRLLAPFPVPPPSQLGAPPELYMIQRVNPKSKSKTIVSCLMVHDESKYAGKFFVGEYAFYLNLEGKLFFIDGKKENVTLFQQYKVCPVQLHFDVAPAVTNKKLLHTIIDRENQCLFVIAGASVSVFDLSTFKTLLAFSTDISAAEQNLQPMHHWRDENLPQHILDLPPSEWGAGSRLDMIRRARLPSAVSRFIIHDEPKYAGKFSLGEYAFYLNLEGKLFFIDGRKENVTLFQQYKVCPFQLHFDVAPAVANEKLLQTIIDKKNEYLFVIAGASVSVFDLSTFKILLAFSTDISVAEQNLQPMHHWRDENLPQRILNLPPNTVMAATVRYCTHYKVNEFLVSCCGYYGGELQLSMSFEPVRE